MLRARDIAQQSVSFRPPPTLPRPVGEERQAQLLAEASAGHLAAAQAQTSPTGGSWGSAPFGPPRDAARAGRP